MRALLPILLLGCTAAVDEAPPVCDEVVSGLYEASGPGFGMPMTATLTFDPAACTFTLDDWSMTHGVEATGGSVDEDAVQLAGGDYWASCAGAVEAGGTELHGECSASTRPDGGAFHLVLLPE